ncbi:hypothetical protein K435DRAFT_959930 [Dendrothele bispora CBS 962.96]|uniref:Uncharacterized protein n=1 Tax=Dendrothele bispora (strain CBS 962.96) TaxID=1314807 RepID=A0A4S8MWE1_DENBC|nr:hypothetical protein K435DRAFT_959930 [Dendrothele bispora CBS 962.96]
MLAVRLNELAASHEQGLLDDDEYRLLRQDVFERYAANPVIPVEAPIVPTVPAARKKQVEFAPSAPSTLPSSSSDLQSQSSRSKPSIVTNLLRRATRRKSKESLAPSIEVDTAPVISLKRSFLPRPLSRKASFDKNSTSSSVSLGSFKTLSSGFFSSPPTSPPSLVSPSSPSWPSQRKPASTLNSKSASKVNLSTPLLDHDIFEDGGLHTTKDIRKAIIDLEEEGKRVVDAFDQLEQSTVAKVQRREQDAYNSLPSLPLSRSHSDYPSSDSHTSYSTSLAVPRRLRSGSTTSAHSVQSSKSKQSISPSSSIGRLRQLSVSSNASASGSSHPKSAAHGFPSNTSTPQLKHKGSISSISSSPASLISIGRSKSKNGEHLSRSTSQYSMSQSQSKSQQSSGANHSSSRRTGSSNSHSHSQSGSLSRSSSHSRSHSRSGSNGPGPSPSTSILRSKSSSSTMMVVEHGRISEVLHEADDDLDSDRGLELVQEAHESQEVVDVRRRKMEVIGRYEAQIEYLKARLKGAELHEKLLRK